MEEDSAAHLKTPNNPTVMSTSKRKQQRSLILWQMWKEARGGL